MSRRALEDLRREALYWHQKADEARKAAEYARKEARLTKVDLMDMSILASLTEEERVEGQQLFWDRP